MQPPDPSALFQVIIYLSGLTCTDENFMQKAGAQRKAAELGVALVAPDTSPRGIGNPGEADSYDFGVGAGGWLVAQRRFSASIAFTVTVGGALALHSMGRAWADGAACRVTR